MPSPPPIEVQNIEVPAFLYGTAWKEDDTARLVTLALQAGFRGIDTANQRRHYYEAAVGEALEEALDHGTVTRPDLFLQTKFTYQAGQDHRLPYDPQASYAEQVQQSFLLSLEHLKTDYIDSYVLHGPMYRRHLSDEDAEVWAAMETLHQSKQVRLLGVSNVDLQQLTELTQLAKVPPAFVQNRCFARTGWDYAVRQYCREQNIVYQGFSLLTANRQIFTSPVFQDIVRSVQRTPPQVIFRFALQRGLLPLTGTSSPEHMREDLACCDFNLSAEALDKIEQILL